MADRNLSLTGSLSVDTSLPEQSPKTTMPPPTQLKSERSSILIEKIDRSLGRYYSSHDRSNYFDEDGKGLFHRYCSINGYDDITVDEELKADPEDCMLLDFDETDDGFPALVSTEDLLLTKFDVIKKCYQDHEPFKNCNFADYDFKISHKMFNVDQSLVQKINEWHSKHCSVLSGISEPLYKLLSVGCEINQPYFQLLADTFSRYRLKRMITMNKHKPIPNHKLLSDFMRQNKHFLELDNRSGNKKCTTIIHNALQQWIKEFPPFKRPYSYIIDHVERITELIAMAIEFVSDLAKTKNVPFQWDYSIAFNKCGNLSEVGVSTRVHYYDNDSDDDDDDFEEKQLQFTSADISTDWLADVVTRLKEQNVKLQQNDLVSKEYILYGITRKINIFVPTALICLICNFAGQILGFHSNHNIIFQEFLKLVDDNYVEYHSNYQKNKRFCTFVDNRDPNNIKRGVYGNKRVDVTTNVFENDNIDVIFYEPPDANFPSQNSKESRHNLFCFHSSAKYILPGTNKALLPSNINSRTFLKGEMLTVSFHVQSEEEIRCYLYLNGGMARFMPQDIMDFLCPAFIENEKNSDFIKSDAMKEMIEKMTVQLRDERFRVFNEKHRF
eukprot:336085_1